MNPNPEREKRKEFKQVNYNVLLSYHVDSLLFLIIKLKLLNSLFRIISGII